MLPARYDDDDDDDDNRTYKEHKNLGILKHVTNSCSGMKPFY